MKNYLIALIAACPVVAAAAQTRPATDYIDPMIGTRSMGHVFPGACVPHGIVQLSPDTEMVPHNIDGKYQPEAYRYCAGYQYDDPTIVGFSHTHLSGTGHSDLGDILLMPTVGEIRTERGTAEHPETGYRSRFSHERERAAAGYYEVMLDDYGIRAQLTATERVGLHKYTYPAGEDQHLILDLDHGIYNYEGKTRWAQVRVENDTLVTGYRITSGWARTNYTYFAMSFSKPVREYGARDRRPLDYGGGWRKFDTERNFPEIGGCGIVMHFDFGDDSAPLEVKVALSAVGTRGALANLCAEAGGRTFDQAAADAARKWEEQMSVIEARDTPGPGFQQLYRFLGLGHLPGIAPAVQPHLPRPQPRHRELDARTLPPERAPHPARMVAHGQRELVHDRLPFGVGGGRRPRQRNRRRPKVGA